MAYFAKLHSIISPPGRFLATCLIILGVLFQSPSAMAHPLQYHLDPLDDQAIERVLTSFDQLAAELAGAGLQNSAQLSDTALGITAIVWSVEDAVAGMDDSRAVDSPSLINALVAAGYENSPYIVAEWKMEAERVWESYEVLTSNIQIEMIAQEMAALEQEAENLTPQQRAEKEAAMLRHMSMLQTTAGDVSRVAPYRQRLDELARRLGN